MTTRITARRDPWQRRIELRLGEETPERLYIAKPVVMEEASSGSRIEPMLVLSDDIAQQLMDELWLAGLRPTEGTGSAGSLAATERHPADMREIAIGVLRKAGTL